VQVPLPLHHGGVYGIEAQFGTSLRFLSRRNDFVTSQQVLHMKFSRCPTAIVPQIQTMTSEDELLF